MEKTDWSKTEAAVPTIHVLPRTLMIRPMEYKHPAGANVYFSGVFGTDSDSKESGDIWVGTFFDRNEAEVFILSSKTFGRPVDGVRLTLQKVTDDKTRDADPQPPQATSGG